MDAVSQITAYETDALAAIATRPGALTNQTYLRLLHEWAGAHTV